MGKVSEMGLLSDVFTAVDSLLGSFSIDYGVGSENVTFKIISVYSNFVAFIPIR